MPKKKRASLELSVNFLVMLVISIVIFGFGLYFIQKTGMGLTEASDQISREAEAQIQSLLDSGEQIIIYPEQLEIRRQETGTFGVGILNTLSSQTAFFRVGVEPSAYITKSGDYNDCTGGNTVDCPSDIYGWTFDDFPLGQIRRNENRKVSIPVKVGGEAAPGIYVFNVYVCYKENSEVNIPCTRDKHEEMGYPGIRGFLKFRVKVP